MEKIKRAGKAIVVIFIVGLGFIHSQGKQSFPYETFSPVSISWDQPSVKCDSVKTDRDGFYVYTKRFIESGIHQLLSNL